MADNVPITPGSGTNIATDDVSGVHFQKMKLDAGGDGASTPITAGVQTSPNSLPVVGPNDEFVTVSVDVTRPADTTTYAINDVICNSTSSPLPHTIANAAKASGGSGVILDITMLTNNDPALPLQCELFIFDSSVTSQNDNAAFNISDADMKKCIAKVSIALEDVGGNGFFHYQGPPIGFTCVGGADLFVVVKAKNAYIPANAELLTFRYKIQRLT
jgi:hypothetical protein